MLTFPHPPPATLYTDDPRLSLGSLGLPEARPWLVSEAHSTGDRASWFKPHRGAGARASEHRGLSPELVLEGGVLVFLEKKWVLLGGWGFSCESYDPPSVEGYLPQPCPWPWAPTAAAASQRDVSQTHIWPQPSSV